MMDRERARVIAWTCLPLVLPLAAFGYVAVNCEDDWCPGGMLQVAIFEVGFAAIIVGSAAWYSSRPIRGWRVGLAAWALGLGVAGLFFATSQVVERDYMVAMVWLWLAGTLLVAAGVLARPRPRLASP